MSLNKSLNIKDFKFGQIDITYNNEDCRLVFLPNLPQDELDVYLAQTYARAVKPTTIANMYSKWNHAVSSELKRKKPTPLEGEVQCYVVSIYNTKTGMSVKEAYNLLNVFDGLVVEDIKNIKNINVLNMCRDDLPVLIAIFRKIRSNTTPEELNNFYLDMESIEQIISTLKK